jgi:hypothetical protein
VHHHETDDLPVHLPILVQAYDDPIDVPWVALHGGRLFGVDGQGLTPKHQRPLHEVYQLAATTRVALDFYVDDRVVEGLWANRRYVIPELAGLQLDLLLTPNYSVWRDAYRFEQAVQQRRAFLYYHWLREIGLPAVPDIGFSRFEPDGRLWAEWINSQADLRAVSIFCGGKRIHAERRAVQDTVEDIALLHQAVRPNVTFVLGGIHAAERLAALRQAAPWRRLVVCNGEAYALAQRRRPIDGHRAFVARSARDCFLANCSYNDRLYTQLFKQATEPSVNLDARTGGH